MSINKIPSKNQLTIPESIIAKLDLKPGDRLEITELKNQIELSAKALRDFLKPLQNTFKREKD